jgi:hypothetical protein
MNSVYGGKYYYTVKMLLKIILYHVNINSAKVKQEQQIQSSIMQYMTLFQNVHSTI